MKRSSSIEEARESPAPGNSRLLAKAVVLAKHHPVMAAIVESLVDDMLREGAQCLGEGAE